MTDLNQQFPTGWHRDDDAVAAYIHERTTNGDLCVFAAAQPDLQGHWARMVRKGIYGVFAHTAEMKLFGRYRPAEFQQRGTCVARGTFRAAQDTIWTAIARKLIVGSPRQIAYEPIYGGARVNVGRGSLGRGDGAVGAWAARWVHDYGLTARGVYGSVDLTDDNESLAVTWGAPGRGVPREVIEGSAAYKVRSYNSESLQQSADACAAGYFGAQCSEWQFGNRDANGMARYFGPTAHCEELSGVFLLPTWPGTEATIYQNTGFVRQQSWGNQPSGPLELAVYGGHREPLRQGEYGIYGDDFSRALRTGEVWHFSEPAQIWRGE